MGLRTYLPTLRFAAMAFCAYVNRNKDTFIKFLDEDQYALVIAGCAAVQAIIEMLDTVIPKPT